MHLEIEFAQFCLKNDKQKIKTQKGGLTLSKLGRYRCAASVKFRLGKIFPKNLVPGQKSDQNPAITRYVFINLKVQKSEFSMSGPLFVCSSIKCSALFIKNHQKPYA